MCRFPIKQIPVENLHGNEVNLWFSLIEFQANFPPQESYLENAESSLDAEGAHHYNIFFLRVYSAFKSTESYVLL